MAPEGRSDAATVRLRRVTRILHRLLVPAALLALACADGSMEDLRRHTYPPDFKYISQEKLESTMWQLAAQVRTGSISG